MSEGILSGLRVLEWGHLVSGPWTARLLGDMGAEVVKIETPGVGDEARTVGPFPSDLPHPEKSGLYLFLNCNKRSVTLNLSTESGRRLFLDLLKTADVLIENHRPSELETINLSYETLKAVNPNFIMISISPFGQTGPYRDYIASELVLFHMGGVGYETPVGGVTERETQPPLKGPGYQAYFVSGWMAATAALVALFHREVTGEGQFVDISEHEAIASMLRPNVARLSYQEEITVRQSVGAIRYKPCKDGYFIGLGMGQNDQAWQQLCALMGNPEWTTREIFLTPESRREHQQEADDLIIEWMKDYTKDELFQMTQQVGMGAFPFNTIADVHTSEQLASRGFFGEIAHPLAGTYQYPGPAYQFSEAQPSISRRAPLLGEHNAEVYCDELGYSREDLVALRRSGVI
jgi:crotonobetainyl-CoA:carnitine CoA-transferase CaiB-like acyl-CoA transferase